MAALAEAPALRDPRPRPGDAREAAVGLLLAAAILAAWTMLHVIGVWLLDAPSHPVAAAVILVAQTWLSVGLFIVAHDAMHGSLAPGRPAVNTAVGRIALLLYAGFGFDRLLPKHHAHHRHPGTEDDPDFDADHPRSLLPWYLAFMRRYFGWREAATLAAIAIPYALLLGPRAPYLAFWFLPSILASFQLFYFGTWLPHRHHGSAFSDHHNARSNAWPAWVSLLTCFHFGYHHEHHLAPYVPWWRLPAWRRLHHA
jgi:beta-carotene ketolase (CrtW type)